MVRSLGAAGLVTMALGTGAETMEALTAEMVKSLVGPVLHAGTV